MEKKISGPISDLPAEIRQHILSFLPTSDAILMGELSSAWKNDWINLPFFDFGHQFWMASYNSLKIKMEDNRYHTSNYSKKQKLNDETSDPRLRYAQFLDQFLLVLKTQKRDEPLKLRIYLYCDFGSDDNSVSMDLAFNTGYELQGLSNYYYDHVENFGFPDPYYLFNLPGYLLQTSKFVTQLNLCGNLWGKMLKTASEKLIFPFYFPNLRKLCITGACLNTRTVKRLLGGCCNTVLEDLMFTRCTGEIFLRLVGFSKLRRLHIEGPPQVRVATPELLSCSCVIMVESKSLQHLHISDCDMLAVKLDTPNLVSFSYEMCRNSGKFMPFLITPIDPLQTSLRLSPRHCANLWHSEVLDFLAKFSHFQRSFKISWNADKSFIVPRELRESTSPPLWRVQHLHIEQLFPLALMPLTESDIHNYVDTALWLSPHPKSISLSARTELSDQGSWCIAVELKYKDGNDEIYGWGCGCYSQPIKCWRHSIKDFRIQNQNGHEDVVAIMTKFFNNAQVQ